MKTLFLILTLTFGLLLAPVATPAQRPVPIPLIGVVRPVSANDPLTQAFRQGLRDLGYVEGQNIRIEYRFAEGIPERIPGLVAELVRLPVDLIVASGAAAIYAAKQATTTIPIVMAFGDDPVATGLVASLARPGGNVTGLSNTSAEFAGKWLELLTEVVPGLSRMAILGRTGRPWHTMQIEEIHAVAARVGIRLEVLEVPSPREFDRAISTMVEMGVGAAIVLDDAMFFNERTRLAALAAQIRTPAMYGNRGFVEAGGLLSYGPDLPALFRRAATYVDKILKGATPADLPIEQPMRFELVINLKTAQALGLTLPPSLLFQADEVIR